MHSANRKKAEDRYEAEHAEKLQIERTAEDQKRTIAESEVRIKARAKEAYLNGLNDGKHTVTTESISENARDFFIRFPTITWPLVGLVSAIFVFIIFKNLAISFPDAVFIVNMAELPLLFWVLLFVLGFFIVRWLFQLLGVIK